MRRREAARQGAGRTRGLDAGAEAQLAGVISERVDASLGGFEHRLTQQLARLPSEVAMQDILARLEQNVGSRQVPPKLPLADPNARNAVAAVLAAGGALLALMLFWGLLPATGQVVGLPACPRRDHRPTPTHTTQAPEQAP
jgi:hypothetical protein